MFFTAQLTHGSLMLLSVLLLGEALIVKQIVFRVKPG